MAVEIKTKIWGTILLVMGLFFALMGLGYIRIIYVAGEVPTTQDWITSIFMFILGIGAIRLGYRKIRKPTIAPPINYNHEDRGWTYGIFFKPFVFILPAMFIALSAFPHLLDHNVALWWGTVFIIVILAFLFSSFFEGKKGVKIGLGFLFALSLLTIVINSVNRSENDSEKMVKEISGEFTVLVTQNDYRALNSELLENKLTRIEGSNLDQNDKIYAKLAVQEVFELSHLIMVYNSGSNNLFTQNVMDWSRYENNPLVLSEQIIVIDSVIADGLNLIEKLNSSILNQKLMDAGQEPIIAIQRSQQFHQSYGSPEVSIMIESNLVATKKIKTMLSLLYREEGKWEIEDGLLLFESEEALAEWNEITDQFNRLSETQSSDQEG